MTVAYRFVAGAAAVLFMAFAGLFAGTAAAQMPGGQQVELTTKLVEQIIASADDVRATAEGLSAKYGMKGKQFGDNPAGRCIDGNRECRTRRQGMAEFQGQFVAENEVEIPTPQPRGIHDFCLAPDMGNFNLR